MKFGSWTRRPDADSAVLPYRRESRSAVFINSKSVVGCTVALDHEFIRTVFTEENAGIVICRTVNDQSCMPVVVVDRGM